MIRTFDPSPFLRGGKRVPKLLLLPLALAACGQQHGNTALAKIEAEQRQHQDDAGNIVCARAGSNAFARTCTVDRAQSEAGLVLTLRHPDGAFRRLLVTKDGRGVIAADGAEPAIVSIIGNGEIEVAVGGDRYRLPATVKAKRASAS